MDCGTITRPFSFITALLVLITGIIHAANRFSEVCDSDENNCVGPWLFWSTGEFTSNVNRIWQGWFSVAPSNFLTNWTPLVAGLLLTLVHLRNVELVWLAGTWTKVCFWHLIIALLCAFGYAGNFGIITGFFCSLVAFNALILSLLSTPQGPTTLSIGCGSGGGGGGGGHRRGNGGSIADISSVLAKVLSFVCAVLLIVCGFIHTFLNELNEWCGNGNNCVGPYLIWNSDSDFVEDANAVGWRTFFTLDPNVLFPIWVTLVVGVISLSSHFPDIVIWSGVASSFSMVCIWYLIVAFFAAFGFAGNLGILTGFGCVFTSLCALITVLSGGTDEDTVFKINLTR